MRKHLKLLLTVLLVGVLMYGGDAGKCRAAEVSWSDDNGCTWEFDDATGILTVSGTGTVCKTSEWEEYCNQVEKIVIEEGITEIEGSDHMWNAAFSYCENVTELVLPESLVKIGPCSFSGCKSLEKIVIPDTVAEIGEYAFWGCSKVTELRLPESLQTIEPGVFGGCKALPKLNIPEGVKEIGKDAFCDCSNLKEVTISQTVTQIGYEAFNNCSKLTKLTLPGTLQKIEDLAFNGCSILQELTILPGITEIGNSAFNGCGSLKKIEIPDTVTVIGNNAFNGCGEVTELKLPKNLQIIAYRAFYDCNSLQQLNIPEGVTTIEDWAFCGCSSLKKIEIPDTVTEMGINAFNECREVTEIKLSKKLQTIAGGAFGGCYSLQELTIPEGVTTIEVVAFYGCSSLKKIEIPDTVTTIEESAFYGCYGATELMLSKNLQIIEKDTFQGCRNLQELIIPEGIIEIKENAFGGCGASQIILPQSLNYINKTAFGSGDFLIGCSNEEQISYCQENNYNYVDMSETPIDLNLDQNHGTLSIAEESYAYTGEEIKPEILVTCKFSNGETEQDIILCEGRDYEVEYSNNTECGTATVKVTGTGIYTGELTGTFKIYKKWSPDNVTLEYESVLYTGKNLEPKVTVKDNGTALEQDKDYTVEYADNLEEGTATVTVIGKGNYEGNENIVKHFTIYKKDITSYTVKLQYNEIIYDGSEKRPSITVSDDKGIALKEGTDYDAVYQNNIHPGQATIIITGKGIYKGTTTAAYTIRGISLEPAEVTLDETIFTYDGSEKKPHVTVTLQGKVLTENVDYVVSYQNNILVGTACVVIQGIWDYEGGVQMSYNILPGGDGAPAVYDKDDTLISGDLIYTITDDEELEVEVAGIADKNLKQLVIPGTVDAEGKTYKVTSVGQKAFYRNNKLQSVVIGNNVASIEDYAFYGCKNVKSIKMGKSVEIIGASAFRKCTKLTSIVLPKSIDKLGKNAFYGCKKLKSITINANSVIDISANAVKGISKKAVIKVPKKLVKGYQKELKGKTGYKKTMKIKKK